MKSRRIYSSILFWVLFSQSVCAQIIENGKWYQKQLGKNFHAQLMPNVSSGIVDLVLSYKEQSIITHTFTRYDTAFSIDGKWDAGSMHGTVKLQYGNNSLYTLDADFFLSDSNHTEQFKGQLAGWHSNNRLGDQLSYDLGTVCNVKTTVSGIDRDITTIVFYSVNTPMYSVTLTSVTPTATISNDITIGRLTISKGARLSMQIPSKYQKGFVMLSCTIKSDDHDPAVFSAQIANWDISP